MSDITTSVTPLLEPRNSKVLYIDTQAQLNDAIDDLASASGPFALDAERASGFKYSQRAYLVQITRLGSAIYLIDPIAIREKEADGFERFAHLLKQDEWILHAATQDLPCLKELGLTPTSIFDTELAGRLLGMPRVGLGALCEEWLELKLAKEHSAVDWSTRPLRDEWLNYAALDVDVLLALRNEAFEHLKIKEKLSWAYEEFVHSLDFQVKPPKPDKWRAMSGMNELKDQRSLAIAKEVWLAREKLAIKMDVSPGRLIPDSAIVYVAKVQPKTRSALAGEKSFTGRASRTYLDVWWQALKNGLETLQLPELKPKLDGIPNHRNWENRHPEAHQRLKTLRPLLVEISEKVELPIENLLQPDLLRQLCWEPPESISVDSIKDFLLQGGARNWQVTLVCDALATGLAELASQ